MVLNAGIALSKKYLTEEGLELHMATNHFGHFLLANLLAPLMARSSNNKSSSNSGRGRIVVVSSVAHWFGKVEIDNLNSERNYDVSTLIHFLYNDIAALSSAQFLSVVGPAVFILQSLAIFPLNFCGTKSMNLSCSTP